MRRSDMRGNVLTPKTVLKGFARAIGQVLSTRGSFQYEFVHRTAGERGGADARGAPAPAGGIGGAVPVQLVESRALTPSMSKPSAFVASAKRSWLVVATNAPKPTNGRALGTRTDVKR